ncbi:MFS transporter [Rhodococcus opacus]|uniref:MFS transporter n=1 Tax=Rhodococcus opacus TaxID=37919 RepID=UPI00080B1246|nr:MFS transporter [Rhodococcus opacus]
MTSSKQDVPPVVSPEVGGGSRVRAWGLTGILVLLVVVNWADKAVFGLVAQPLATEFGLTSAQIGLVGSAFFLAFTVGGFFAGVLHKWMSLRWLLLLLCLAWAASMVPLVVVAGFTMLLISRMALGFFEGPSGALIHTGAYSWHPVEKRGLPGAFLASGASIAKILIAPLMALAVANWGWRSTFLILAMVSVVWSVVWLVTWQGGPYGKRPVKKAAANFDTAAPTADPKVPWSRILRTPTFLGALAAVFTMYALVTVVLTWLPSYFEVGLGYSRVQAGTMFGIPSIAGLFFMFLCTSVSDRLLVRGASSRVLRGIVPGIALLLCGVALITMPYIQTPIVAVMVVSIGYGVGTVIIPLFNAAISEICPPQQMAGVLGVFMAMMATGGLIAPYLTGVIVDNAATPAGGYASAFQIFGIAAVIGAVIALLTVNSDRDRARILG